VIVKKKYRPFEGLSESSRGKPVASFVPSRITRASFVERPNRFLVRGRLEGGGVVAAQMPNPGRLKELLLPGVPLFLVEETPRTETSRIASRAVPNRKTRFTVWAVERDGRPVFLHTHRTNDVARYLLERKRIPGLEYSEIVRAEAVHGHSRFDFLMRERVSAGENSNDTFFFEVKSVTLFGNGAAMFPDAVTERGRRHLEELASLGEAADRVGAPKPVVLFLVHTDRVDRFLPDYHTDLAFARTLLDVRDRVRILPVSLPWTRSLRPGRPIRLLDIPWQFIEQEAHDRGAYLLLLRLPKSTKIAVGSLGTISLLRGWYVYAGSAMQNLSARIARHVRKRKRFHWHIDFLRDAADECHAVPIRSSTRDECEIASSLGAVFFPGPRGFGASDCDCPTHLFRCVENPFHRRDFHDLLERFRMRRPVERR